MYLLTNVSVDEVGRVYSGYPTKHDTESEAIASAKASLMEDFDLTEEELKDNALEYGTPYVLTMSRDGRTEIYTVAEEPVPSFSDESVSEHASKDDDGDEYIVSLALDCRVDVRIRSKTFEEAKNKAKAGLNADIDWRKVELIKSFPVNISDSQHNILEDF